VHSSFTFVKIKGIPIGAHWSWVFVFGLLLWSLARGLFPSTYPGLGTGTYVTMAAVTVVLFFVSILLHELGHALQALKEGMRIEGITLWLFGGVAAFRGMFPSSGAEFRIAIAGPAVSVALAAFFGALAFLGNIFSAPTELQGVVDYLARINTILVLFNMIPALPLDGGRVLRSILWRHQRSFSAATASAARAGKIFGGVLAAVGLLNFFTGGAGAGGMWLVFLGWFLVQAAQSEAAVAVLQQVLSGRRIRDLMTPEPVTVSPQMTLDDFVDRAMSGRAHSSYPVVEDGRAVGLMPLRRAGQTAADERRSRRVADVMLGIDEVPVLPPDTDMKNAFEHVQEEPRRALVVDDGRLVGILSMSDVVRAIELQQTLGTRPEPHARRVNPLIWAPVILIMALAAGALYHPPLVVLEPGPAIDVVDDISIEGVPVDRINGEYVLVSVRLEQPSALGALVAAVSADKEVIPASDVVPEGIDPEQFAAEQREIFEQSRQIAAAAGARAAGLSVSVEGSGAEVLDLVPGSPAAAALEPGDVIVAIDGRSITTAQDVQSEIRARPAGTRFGIEVERGGRKVVEKITSERMPELVEGIAGIGVSLGTSDLRIDLPFQIEFRDHAIGGPSAGLAYALAVADLLDEADLAGGRTIAASGSINVDGAVDPVGGLRGKTAAADRVGADIFFVPDGQIEEVGDGDARARAVESLEDALEVLRAAA
jgi:PDZ domain-containing secreted protein/Zn-dependent protease/CBS domain-containing protein